MLEMVSDIQERARSRLTEQLQTLRCLKVGFLDTAYLLDALGDTDTENQRHIQVSGMSPKIDLHCRTFSMGSKFSYLNLDISAVPICKCNEKTWCTGLCLFQDTRPTHNLAADSTFLHNLTAELDYLASIQKIQNIIGFALNLREYFHALASAHFVW